MNLRPRRAEARSPQAGFTLIEVLVVMILMGLITGVLFQALERAYRLKNHFAISLTSVQQSQMTTDWYRQSINSLFPDFSDGSQIFQGKALQLSGLSTHPLNSDAGAPTPITWQLKHRPADGITQLIYTEAQRDTQLMSWRSTSAHFIYLDDQGLTHTSWPPALGKFPQLPTQIQIQSKDKTGDMTLVASIMGQTNAPLRLRDILGTAP
jgi:prepilin-type N-terminal cleavage/methylation domain-containing protein